MHGKGTGQQYIFYYIVYGKNRKNLWVQRNQAGQQIKAVIIVTHTHITQTTLAFCLPAEELEDKIMISVLHCSKSPSQYSVNQK